MVPTWHDLFSDGREEFQADNSGPLRLALKLTETESNKGISGRKHPNIPESSRISRKLERACVTYHVTRHLANERSNSSYADQSEGWLLVRWSKSGPLMPVELTAKQLHTNL